MLAASKARPPQFLVDPTRLGKIKLKVVPSGDNLPQYDDLRMSSGLTTDRQGYRSGSAGGSQAIQSEGGSQAFASGSAHSLGHAGQIFHELAARKGKLPTFTGLQPTRTQLLSSERRLASVGRGSVYF